MGWKGSSVAAPSRIIVALDFADAAAAAALAKRLRSKDCGLKVGKELFARAGPGFIEQLHADGFDVFLDLKFHDIPNTVAAACRAVADLGVWMMNVHASGGAMMMRAAAAALANYKPRPLCIAVTALTSMDDKDLAEVGVGGGATAHVDRLAALAAASGMDGVVCSAQEASSLRQAHAKDFLLVAPGIRPRGANTDDQQRVATPAAAVESGVNHIVVGRPITRAADPMRALQMIRDEMKASAPR